MCGCDFRSQTALRREITPIAFVFVQVLHAICEHKGWSRGGGVMRFGEPALVEELLDWCEVPLKNGAKSRAACSELGVRVLY